jgi:hypothetical protein
VELAAWSSLPLVTMLPNGSEAESGGPKREAASSMAGFGEWFADRRASAAAINVETTSGTAMRRSRLHVGLLFLFFFSRNLFAPICQAPFLGGSGPSTAKNLKTNARLYARL